LESSHPPQPVSSIATILASSSVVAAGSADTAVQEKKKVRMARVPAGVVPGVTPPPDPERWLKKSERSTFMQGNKKKKGGGGGATQGSVEHVPAVSSLPSKAQAKGKKKK
jgi:signal recognition particle subunit SRP72